MVIPMIGHAEKTSRCEAQSSGQPSERDDLNEQGENMTTPKGNNLDAALKMEMSQPLQFSEMREIIEANWPQRPDLKEKTMREDAILNCLLLVIEKQAQRLQLWSEQLVKLAKMGWPPPRPFNEVLEIHHDGEVASQMGYVMDTAARLFAADQTNALTAEGAVDAAMMLWEAVAAKYPEGCTRDLTEEPDGE